MLWSWPLPVRLATDIAGAGAGDNFCFLWNFHWMREALASGSSFFYSPLLFAPRGIDLTLHTHTALPAWIGATVLGGLPVAAALNITIVVSLFLAAWCTYLLCWRLTRDATASVVAAIVFASSPYLTTRLSGHFNLTHAWVLPLFACLAYEAIRKRSRLLAACAGAVWGATAYIDYYYVVCQGLLGLVLWVVHAEVITIRFLDRTPAIDRMRQLAAVLIAPVAAFIVLVAATGGFELTVGSIRVSAKGLFNPLQVLWVLVAIGTWTRIRPVVRWAARRDDARTALRMAAVSSAIFALLALPLLWRAVRAGWQGAYTTQDFGWRSGPDGIDAATFLLGYPFHPLWGESVQGLYRARGIELVESSAFLGVSLLMLAVLAIRHCWGRFGTREWTVLGFVFLIWSLGPHLQVFGFDSGMILPHAFARYLPLVSNARMPGRAVVVVYLVLAVLTAVAIAGARTGSVPRRWALPATALIFIEFARGPIAIMELPDARRYEQLRQRSEQGALLELPLGVRDGFGELGQLDERDLYFQTVHGRPLLGGFVARLPPDVRNFYKSDPLLAILLQLSAGGPPAAASVTPEAVAESLSALNVGFVSVDNQSASADLRGFVADKMPLSLLAADEFGALYVVQKRR